MIASREKEVTFQPSFAVRPTSAVGEVSGALQRAGWPRKIDAKNSTSSANDRTPLPPPPFRGTTREYPVLSVCLSVCLSGRDGRSFL